MECLSYCIADKIDLQKAESKLKKNFSLKIERSREVIHASDHELQKEVFIFKNGSLVTWGYKRYETKRLIQTLHTSESYSIKEMSHDEFSCKYANITEMYPDDYFSVDRICLASQDTDIKLAISYGLSVSIKLNLYETKLEQLIIKHHSLLETGYQKGGFNTSRKNLNKILSEIIATKNKVNLSSEILYQPKFFWRHPNLEFYYTLTSNYLDVQTRIQTINQQLESLNETFQLFNSYLINEHSHYLEIVIIVLIAAEIIFSLLNLHLNW